MLDLAYIKQNAMELAKESWWSGRHSSWIAPERVLVMVAEIERLQAERDELRAALKPLATRGLWRDHYPDASYDRLLVDNTMVEDVYRARAALSAPLEDK